MFKATSGTFRYVFAGRGHFGGYLVQRWSEFGLIAIEEWTLASIKSMGGRVEFPMGLPRR